MRAIYCYAKWIENVPDHRLYRPNWQPRAVWFDAGIWFESENTFCFIRKQKNGEYSVYHKRAKNQEYKRENYDTLRQAYKRFKIIDKHTQPCEN